MNLFKKLLAALLAVVMACGVFTFVGCLVKSSEQSPINSVPEEPTPEEPTPEGPALEEPTPEDVITSVLGGMVTNRISTITFSGDGIVTVNQEKNSEVLGESAKVTANCELDLDAGDMASTFAVMQDPDNPDNFGDYFETTNFYADLEQWVLVCNNGSSQSPSFDLQQMLAEYIGEIKEDVICDLPLDMIKELTGVDLLALYDQYLGAELIDIQNYVNLFFNRINYEILAIANATETITYGDQTLTVDFLDTIKSSLNTSISILESIDESTTVGDVLRNENFKKIYASYLSPIPLDFVKELLGGIFPDISGEDTYDYLVNIICSEEFRVLANNIFNELHSWGDEILGESDYPVTSDFELFTQTIDKYSLATLIELQGRNIDDLYEGIDEIKNALDSEMPLLPNTTFQKLIVTYTYNDDYELTGQTLEVEMSYTHESYEYSVDESIVYDEETGEEYYEHVLVEVVETTTQTFTGTVSFSFGYTSTGNNPVEGLPDNNGDVVNPSVDDGGVTTPPDDGGDVDITYGNEYAASVLDAVGDELSEEDLYEFITTTLTESSFSVIYLYNIYGVDMEFYLYNTEDVLYGEATDTEEFLNVLHELMGGYGFILNPYYIVEEGDNEYLYAEFEGEWIKTPDWDVATLTRNALYTTLFLCQNKQFTYDEATGSYNCNVSITSLHVESDYYFTVKSIDGEIYLTIVQYYGAEKPAVYVLYDFDNTTVTLPDYLEDATYIPDFMEYLNTHY